MLYRFLLITSLLSIVPMWAFGMIQTNGTFDKPKSIEEVLKDRDNDNKLDFLGEHVTVSGRATVASFVFHEEYFTSFMQDADAAIMLYSGSLDKKINVGDSLVVSGKLKLYYGKPEIVIDSLIVVETASLVVPPIKLVQTFENPEKYLGRFVEGEALITGMDLYGEQTNITISPTDTTRLNMWIYISNNHKFKNDFNFSHLSLGDRVEIAGILDKYLIDGDVIYEIMPRSPDDITYVGLPQKFKNALLWGGGVLIFVAIGWGFTLRRQVNARTKELSKALDDKNVLMQEFHHRVKNNLSIIVGLLELKIMSTHNQELINGLEDTKSRINSLALIHDKLYQKHTFEKVRLDLYLQELVEAIHGTFSNHDRDIEKKFKMEPVEISVTKAVNCGLLVNELVVNAFKHAFCDIENGKLEIVLEKLEDEQVLRLSIKDNGPGFEGNFTEQNSGGIGTMLIESIADQLDADLNINSSNGTCISLQIPLDA